MQTITYLLKFVFFCFLSGAIFLICYFLYSEYKDYRKRKRCEENFYNMKYLWLSELIEKLPIDKANYDYLLNQLVKLGQMGFKDREKTQTLTTTFFRRFIDFSKITKADEAEADRKNS